MIVEENGMIGDYKLNFVGFNSWDNFFGIRFNDDEGVIYFDANKGTTHKIEKSKKVIRINKVFSENLGTINEPNWSYSVDASLEDDY